MASLGMVTILVDNYDRAIDYFTRCLGFWLVEDTILSAEKRWVVIAPDVLDGTKILLARASSPSQELAIGNHAGGRVGLFLYTTNFDFDYTKMLAAGVEFTEAPRHETFGKVVVFKDIFGNKWDFIERIPTA